VKEVQGSKEKKMVWRLRGARGGAGCDTRVEKDVYTV
jgi:hypothetical protein